jgi:hypothetical protein
MRSGNAPRFENFSVALAALLIACVAPICAVHAQSLSERQVLRAPAQGEGAPNLLFGGLVAVDGDLAVVAERRMGAQLRGYRRIANAWQRAPELDWRRPTVFIDDLALSEGRLIYSTELANSAGRALRILRSTATGWVQ